MLRMNLFVAFIVLSLFISTCFTASTLVPAPCQKQNLLQRLNSYIEDDEPIAFRITIEHECRNFINFSREKDVYGIVPKILESSLPVKSRVHMLTSFALHGCYLPFHRALYKSSALQPIEVWKMLKRESCAPNSFYLNVIAQKYPENSKVRSFIVEWMLQGLKKGLWRTSEKAASSSPSARAINHAPLPEIQLPEPQVKPLQFGFLRGHADLKDQITIHTKNIRGQFSFMGYKSVLDESYLGLMDNIYRPKYYLPTFAKMRSLHTASTKALGKKIKEKNASFGFVRLLAEPSRLEALLYKDIKLIVLSRDENDDVQFVFPPNPYTSLKESSEELQHVIIPIKAADIVLLMKRESFLPHEAPQNREDPSSDMKELKPHDLSGIFYFCNMEIFDQLFRLLNKHVQDRIQSVVGGFVHRPSSKTKRIMKNWNKIA